MAIADAIRKQFEKKSVPEMELNMWFNFNRIAIEVKAREFHKEGLSKEFIEKWCDHAYNQLIKDYNKELKKIKESHN